MNFSQLQLEVLNWSINNFGNQPSWKPLLGVQEEVGELSHAYLKRSQGIRKSDTVWRAEMEDAVADIIIYLADFCSKEAISMQEVVEETWSRVSKRDWKKNPEDAHVRVSEQ